MNGTNRSATWILDRGGDPLLSAINVFDSKTANVHVDQTNDVAYTPLPLKILATLAIACGDVKERIVKDIRKLKDQTPAVIAKPTCQLGTRVGKLLNALATAKPDDVRTLATLAADDKARLVTLKTELSADPARMNRQLLSLKARLDRNYKAEQIAAAVADDKIATLRAAFRTYAAARQAAQAASTRLFADEPLPEIGSDVWRALWEAARRYSEEAAYKDQSFPVTTGNARCVLCLQDLNPAGIDRLSRFEAFVKDESKRREVEARTLYESALDELTQARIPLGDGRGWPGLSVMIWVMIHWRRIFGGASSQRFGVAAMCWTHQGAGELKPPPVAAPPVPRLRALSADLQTRAAALIADGNSDARKTPRGARRACRSRMASWPFG